MGFRSASDTTGSSNDSGRLARLCSCHDASFTATQPLKIAKAGAASLWRWSKRGRPTTSRVASLALIRERNFRLLINYERPDEMERCSGMGHFYGDR